jgi:thioredoxin-related protein
LAAWLQQGTGRGQGEPQAYAPQFYGIWLVRVVHQIRQGNSVATAVQKLRARQSRAGGAWFSSYEVLGFPTIVVLNSNGQKVWQFDGYFSDGPDAFIAQLQKLPKG